MTVKRVIGAVFCGVTFGIAGVAAASGFSSSAQTAYVAQGKHQFYVWCAGSSDYMAEQNGTNAEDAQMKLYNSTKAAGKTTCWPIWQGKVTS